MGARVSREDIEDQASAVDHTSIEQLLDITCLAGCQLVVEHHQIILELFAQLGDLCNLAGADEMLGERLLEPLVEATDDIQAGSIGQQRQLTQRVLGAPGAAVAGQLGADQEGALARRLGGMQSPPVGGGGDSLFSYSRAPFARRLR